MTEIQKNQGNDLVPVLWMDDEPEFIKILKRLVEIQEIPFKIDINAVTTIDEARNELNSTDYGALIVDCRMDKYDLTLNGAEFLLEINEKRKELPTFVYSSYLDDPIYRKYLERSNAISAESKATISDEKDLNRLLETVYLTGQKFMQTRNLRPEAIQFSSYLRRPEGYLKDVDAHWKKHGGWISIEMKRKGYLWCVVCGDRIMQGSNDLSDYPNEEELMKIGRETNLIPFAYSVDILPEEIPPQTGSNGVQWKGTSFVNDFYPSLNVRIESKDIISDFDTGAFQTCISDKLIKKGLLDSWRDSNSHHLGQQYRFFSKKQNVTLVDSIGNSKTKEINIKVIQDWERSPFVLINRTRRVLVGRDMLRAFNLEIILDTKGRTTNIRHT